MAFTSPRPARPSARPPALWASVGIPESFDGAMCSPRGACVFGQIGQCVVVMAHCQMSTGSARATFVQPLANLPKSTGWHSNEFALVE